MTADGTEHNTHSPNLPAADRRGTEHAEFTPENKSPRSEMKERKPSFSAAFAEIAEVAIGAILATILVLTVFFRTGIVSGTSMESTMSDGDRYVISDLFYTPKQGDVVVFLSGIEGEDELWIKRVIATEGQTVYIDPTTCEVFVDGERLDEPYLSHAATVPHTTENPITVPQGCVYVMGDNRAVSHDSRYSDLGCVPVGQIAGHVLFRFFPFEKFGSCD